MSQDCLMYPLAKPVCPDVVPIIAPIDKSCEPSLTAFPSSLAPTEKSPDPTGQDNDKATSAILRELDGTTIDNPESAKLPVKAMGRAFRKKNK